MTQIIYEIGNLGTVLIYSNHLSLSMGSNIRLNRISQIYETGELKLDAIATWKVLGQEGLTKGKRLNVEIRS